MPEHPERRSLGRRLRARAGHLPTHVAVLWLLVLLCQAGVDVRSVVRQLLSGGLQGGLSPASASTSTAAPTGH